jgi:hypothetical protein
MENSPDCCRSETWPFERPLADVDAMIVGGVGVDRV